MAESKKPLPFPTPETKRFWEGTKNHELVIQRCNDCQRFYFYPRPYCPRCMSENTEWVKVSGKGKLHTYVINHRAAPGFEQDAPYVIAIVELAEGPRMMTNLIEVEPDPEKIKIDMPVEVVFEDMTEEITLPKFRPVT